MISAVDLARVRAAADLVAIAGEHTQLKRVGRQWMATCPFHKEPTPSLSINAEEGLWWCFGCQQGGDAITFVQRIHHFEFVDAVEWLAARAGITLAPQPGEANHGAKTQLVAITGQAAEWYHGQLLDNAEAQPARDYLAGRGVTRELLGGPVARTSRQRSAACEALSAEIIAAVPPPISSIRSDAALDVESRNHEISPADHTTLRPKQ